MDICQRQRTFRENVQISLGDGDCGSGISRYRNRRWSFQAGGRGAWAAAGWRADVFRAESGVLAEPIARSLDFDNNCVVKQSIKQLLWPVRSEDHRALVIAGVHQLEDRLPPPGTTWR